MKNFLIGSKNIDRSSYVWNMLGTTIMAFQSVILLMILTRVLGLRDSGMFTIAYANANLLLIVGKYGMHNFHVSDTKALFNFGDYRASRYMTVTVMLIASVAYIIIASSANDYTLDKALVMLWMCLFKAVDAIEDVYCSFYQKNGRLDISGKMITVRVVITMIFFIAMIIITRSLLISVIASTVFTFALFLLLNSVCKKMFTEGIGEKFNMSRVIKLLGACFVLFVIGFLSYYITNAPKYSIDALLSDELQACYGFISMPVFVIGLMGNYLFNPIIKALSEKWSNGDFAWFRSRLLRQTAVVVGITAVCLAGAYFLGIPVLSLIYGTDLGDYRAELLVLLASGGLLALSNQFMTIITIIRRQKWLLVGYFVCAAAALIASPTVVKNYSIMGAAVMELIIMLFLCVFFAIILTVSIVRAKKNFVPKS